MKRNSSSYPHLKPLKYFAMFLFVILPFVSFLIGMKYQDFQFMDTADPRTRIFTTQQECESFTQRKCLPTICERDPNNASCKTNNQKGWFAARVASSTIPDSTMPANTTPQETCTNAGGKWIADYNECEGMNQSQCSEFGGSFNECASACRHNPDPNAACIQMCVPVCSFK